MIERPSGRSVGLLRVALAILTTAGPASAQQLDWGPCPQGGFGDGEDPRQECALLTVPLDYSNPSVETIDVAVSRILTADPAKRRGVMLFNPGGPGSRGLNRPSVMAARLPAEVQERYDLIGFDPRGLGRSAPISCSLAPEDISALAFIPYPRADLDISENVAYSQRAAAGCTATSGDVLPHMNTANTARDMDAIRAALGEPKISYMGFSYGTYLGAVYTQLFPQRTDRFVLDSNIHPRRIWRSTIQSWGYAVEVAYDGFTRWAADRDDVYGLGDTPAEVYELTIETARALDADPCELSSGALLTGQIFRETIRNNLLRAGDPIFPAWAELLPSLAECAGIESFSAIAERPFEAALEPDVDGGVTAAAEFPEIPADNGLAQPWAIFCGDADWPEDPATYQREVRLFDSLFPLHGRSAANIWPCAFWPFDPPAPVAIDALRGGRVVLVQSVRDPATPYDGGVSLHLALGDRSRLVTVEDVGHVITYNARNTCADAYVTAFLVSGTQPPHAAFCARDPVAQSLGDAQLRAAQEASPPGR
jgi:pimeloyl-ACP methyl ester carboxylesterase